MITFKIDVSGALESISQKIAALKESAIAREDVDFLLDEMVDRIHREGKASDGSQIGTYSPAYMKVRTGNYRNSRKFTRGAKAGELKDAGMYTRGRNATYNIKSRKLDASRPIYQRSKDTKIVVSLTRQLENDWAIFLLNNGKGIGFNNPYNYQKLKWVEATKNKKIGMPTKQEKEILMQRIRARVREILNG